MISLSLVLLSTANVDTEVKAMIPQETTSLLLGYASIGFWLGAQFPQIVVNLRRKSVDGLALPFLANWLLGDSTNLIGCILTNQLPFQTYLAIYFVLVDSCLVVQYLYYDDTPRAHIDASAEGLISSASSIIIAPPPHAPRPRTSSRLGASSLISGNAAMSSLSPTRRRAKSVGPMNMSAGDSLSTGIQSSSRDVTHHRTTTDGVLSRYKDGWDGVRSNADNIEGGPEANFTQDPQDEEEDSDSHMITSFYSEGGGAHRPNTGKRVSWVQDQDSPSVSRDRDQAAPGTTTRYRQRSRSIGFASTTTNIAEEVISSSPTNFDDRGRPTTPRSVRMIDPEDGEGNDPGYDYKDTHHTQQPFPSSSLSRERNTDLDSPHYYKNRSRSRRASSTSTSALTEGASRRSASIVFLGVFVLLGFSTFNHKHYSSTFISPSSTWQGDVLTPVSPEHHNHRRQHYHYYLHPLHHTYQTNTYITTHIPRDNSQSFLDDDHSSDTEKLIGRLAAWTCATLYLTSRLPQIWKNYTRKSVEGLSMYLFAFAFCGNLFYVLSILTSPKVNLPSEQSREFLRESVPYLLGSGGTLMFDVTIVIQSFLYANAKPDRKKRMRTRTLSSVMSSATTSSRRWRGKIKRKRSSAVVNDEERGLLEEEDGLMHGGVGVGAGLTNAGAGVIIGGSESRGDTTRLQAAEIPV